MNKNVLTIGMVVGAIAAISSPINAQSIVDNRLWLAQSERNSSPSTPKTDSQGCVYEKEAPGSSGKPTKICKKPQFNGIRIDACLLAYGACNTKASAEEFCRLQGDGYTEYYNDKGIVPDRPSQTISITNGKIHQTKNKTLAPFSYKFNNNGQLAAFSYIRCRNPQSIANSKPKREQDSIDKKLCKDNGQYVVFAQRPLAGRNEQMPQPRGTFRDRNNIQRAHEHIFFCKNRKIERNIGIGREGRFSEENISKNYALIDNKRYDSQIIDEILGSSEPKMCYASDGLFGTFSNNCQHFAARVRQEYWKRKPPSTPFQK
jgi:hypothetical protein